MLLSPASTALRHASEREPTAWPGPPGHGPFAGPADIRKPAARPVPGPAGDHAAQPAWLVTVHTHGEDGRRGRHSFVERAGTGSQAVDAALARATTLSACRHRRDATIGALDCCKQQTFVTAARLGRPEPGRRLMATA
ncbi:hypothetical protein [Kitasatospora herbaricolor]|uniref:Uncharacterized protein n=1 Tax=Kitasatospora herbaricolor TaxID=68217 RepID=A0ABZ1W2M3_9ACTN|nr:hypothetical protein [Kitasatospora herbaricolor]